MRTGIVISGHALMHAALQGATEFQSKASLCRPCDWAFAASQRAADRLSGFLKQTLQELLHSQFSVTMVSHYTPTPQRCRKTMARFVSSALGPRQQGFMRTSHQGPRFCILGLHVRRPCHHLRVIHS